MPWYVSLWRVLRLGRVHFVAAGFLLFAFGALVGVLAGADFSAYRLIFGYLVFMPAHLSVSYSNDYFDTEVDALGEPTLFTGGSGILVRYPELRSLARALAIGLIACSMTLAVVFVVVYSFTPWLLGYVLLGNLLGWFYAAPPVRLSYRGLGEISTAVTIGLLVPGIGYLIMMGGLDGMVLPLIIPLLLVGVTFILSVQIPDVEADRLGGKHTLVSRIGRRTAFRLIGLSTTLLVAYLALVPAGGLPFSLRALGLCALPLWGMGLLGLIRQPSARPAATQLVNGLLTTIIVFVALGDIYLARLIWVAR